MKSKVIEILKAEPEEGILYTFANKAIQILESSKELEINDEGEYSTEPSNLVYIYKMRLERVDKQRGFEGFKETIKRLEQLKDNIKLVYALADDYQVNIWFTKDKKLAGCFYHLK